MQKKLVILLIIFNLALLGLNVWNLCIDRKVREAEQKKIAEVLQSMQIQKSQAAEENSVGTQAGQAVQGLQVQAQDSYQSLGVQMEKTKEEFQKTTDETMKVLNQEAAKTSQELKTAAENMLQVIQEEIRKFNEALKQPRT